MSAKSTHKASGTDWDRLRTMQDEEIVFDEDSPQTHPGDWEGAKITLNNQEIERVRLRGPQKAPLKVSTTLRLPPVYPALLEDLSSGLHGIRVRAPPPGSTLFRHRRAAGPVILDVGDAPRDGGLHRRLKVKIPETDYRQLTNIDTIVNYPAAKLSGV